MVKRSKGIWETVRNLEKGDCEPEPEGGSGMGLFDSFTVHQLDDTHLFYSGQLPDPLVLSDDDFDALWDSHPEEFRPLNIHGRVVDAPRWVQAYGQNYSYSGQVNEALHIRNDLEPFLRWSRAWVDERLNGLLLNWYDGALGHYIGRHRDIVKGLVEGSPIVTMSFGEERVFRLRPWKGKGYVDHPAAHGTVFIVPYETNLTWTHEVPHSKKFVGKRISVTLRAFDVR